MSDNATLAVPVTGVTHFFADSLQSFRCFATKRIFGAKLAMNKLEKLIADRGFLVADGATGTNLFEMGLQTGDAPEPWNVDHPERIVRLHQGFVDAGSDIILTNSFGGNSFRLKLHQNESRVVELNRAAAQVARSVADATEREVLVAGSIGPTGELFAPMGDLTMASATAAFTEQAQALAEGGADMMWVETMSSKEEVVAALAGASTTNLPIVCTLSFDTNGSTMMGLSPADFAEMSRNITVSPHAYGSNCGLGPAESVVGILNLANAAKPGDILVAKGNCGIPEYNDGVICYSGNPELMADYARLAYDAGARIIGGCCGSTYEHVRCMREALDAHVSSGKPKVEHVKSTLGEISPGARAMLEGKLHADTIAVGGKRTNARRRKRA
ncbi:MAG: betaine--homocysteine S-methyltransferase [Pseudomonadota bacterium]